MCETCVYASFIRPADGSNRGYVDFGTKTRTEGAIDRFIARNNEQNPDQYIFEVYDTHSQEFTGGQGDDEFYFRMSRAVFTSGTAGEWPVVDIVLNGGAGQDSITFQQQKETQLGVFASLGTQSDPAASFFYPSVEGIRGRLQLLDIEQVTGTFCDDTLIDNTAWNSILNGNGGIDTLRGGAGNNTLKTELGFATGGAGRDSYVLLKSEQKGLLTIRENPAGEESTILLPGALSQIQQIYQEGENLCLDLDNGNSTTRTVKLEDFYRQISPAENASRYAIQSNDGFSFQLVAGTKYPLIPVRYDLQNDKTLNGAEVKTATYHAQSARGGAILNLFTHDSTPFASRQLPAFFELELRDLSDKQVYLYGDKKDNVLVAAAGFGSLMRGNSGADTYIVRPSEQSGELYIDNVDRSDFPAEDLLILPWRFDEIAWSDKMNGVVASHHSRSPLSDSVVTQSVDVTLSMNEEEPSHLSVRDITGETRRFFRSQSKGTYLSDTPVFMKDNAQLELTYASGSLVLDARNRRLTEENDQPTVIVDKSQAGNEFHGTKNLQNLMIATGGNNTFYLGDKGDEVHGGAQEDKFYSGKGNDVIYGEGGDDSYYFGKEHGEDIIMDSAGQLSLDFTAEGLGEDDVTLSVNGNDLEIRAKGNEDSNVVRIKEWEGRIGYITLDNRVRLAGDNINALINEMSALPPTELSTPFFARLEAVVQRYWIPVPQ